MPHPGGRSQHVHESMPAEPLLFCRSHRLKKIRSIYLIDDCSIHSRRPSSLSSLRMTPSRASRLSLLSRAVRVARLNTTNLDCVLGLNGQGGERQTARDGQLFDAELRLTHFV